MSAPGEATGGGEGAFALDAALLALSMRERRPRREIEARLREGDGRLHAELRVCLAWALHRALREAEPAVRDVYVIGSSLEEARPVSDLDLVIVAERVDDALRARVDALDAQATRAYARLAGPLPPGFRLIDAHYVDARDAQAGGGFAAAVRGSGVPWYLLPV